MHTLSALLLLFPSLVLAGDERPTIVGNPPVTLVNTTGDKGGPPPSCTV